MDRAHALARRRINAKSFYPPRMLRMAYSIDADALPKADLVVSAGGETHMPISASRAFSAPPASSAARCCAGWDLRISVWSSRPTTGTPEAPRYLVTLKPSSIDPDALGRPATVPRYGPDCHPKLAGLLVGGNAGPFRYRRWSGTGCSTLRSVLEGLGHALARLDLAPHAGPRRRQGSPQLAKDESVVARFIDYRTAGPGTLPEDVRQGRSDRLHRDSSTMISEAVSARLPVVGVRRVPTASPTRSAAYRDFLVRNNWCRVLPIAALTPDTFARALAEIEPIEQNPLDALAAKLKERLPGLF